MTLSEKRLAEQQEDYGRVGGGRKWRDQRFQVTKKMKGKKKECKETVKVK